MFSYEIVAWLRERFTNNCIVIAPTLIELCEFFCVDHPIIRKCWILNYVDPANARIQSLNDLYNELINKLFMFDWDIKEKSFKNNFRIYLETLLIQKQSLLHGNCVFFTNNREF